MPPFSLLQAEGNLNFCLSSALMDVFTELHTLCGHRFYLFPDIPPKKLNNARNSYAADLHPATEIFALLDTSFWGSAKFGCFFTATRICSRDPRFGIKRIAITPSTTFSIKNNLLLVNNSPLLSFHGKRK